MPRDTRRRPPPAPSTGPFRSILEAGGDVYAILPGELGDGVELAAELRY
jgi:hypothetical protein